MFNCTKKNQILTMGISAITLTLISGNNAIAATVNLNFTKLTGLTGGSPQGTAIYRAELTGIGFDLNSITILDNSSGLGGATGQFTGFDLDGIILSNTSVNNASGVNSITSLNVFNFNPGGTFLTPGIQRNPTDPKLFGTTASGNSVDNSVATLESFDGNSTTAIPGADGFVSLGDNGKIAFNLTSTVSTSSPLFLYIGEVGDNGEVASGSIIVSSSPVPEPLTILGAGTAIAFGTGFKRKLKKIQKK